MGEGKVEQYESNSTEHARHDSVQVVNRSRHPKLGFWDNSEDGMEDVGGGSGGWGGDTCTVVDSCGKTTTIMCTISLHLKSQMHFKRVGTPVPVSVGSWL